MYFCCHQGCILPSSLHYPFFRKHMLSLIHFPSSLISELFFSLWRINGLVSGVILCPSRRSGVCAASHWIVNELVIGHEGQAAGVAEAGTGQTSWPLWIKPQRENEATVKCGGDTLKSMGGESLWLQSLLPVLVFNHQVLIL